MSYCCSNAEYSDPFWTIIRGEKEPETIREHVSSAGCCSDSGAASKIISYFRMMGKTLWGSELTGLVETLSVMRDACPGMCLTVMKCALRAACAVTFYFSG